MDKCESLNTQKVRKFLEDNHSEYMLVESEIQKSLSMVLCAVSISEMILNNVMELSETINNLFGDIADYETAITPQTLFIKAIY